MTGHRIQRKSLWEEHERRVLGVFEFALELLARQDAHDVCEDELNRRLLCCIRTANCQLKKGGEGVDHPVMYEANNQPDANDEERTRREFKRPDFQWGLTDSSERNPLHQDKFYIIECKRLGDPLRKDWVFNQNYVENGILRFVCAEHGYGKSTPSGAMVGYIRNMASEEILDEVNGNVTNTFLCKLKLSGDVWVDKGVSRLEQKIDRPEVPPTPFTLRHLWVDLRHE